MQVGIGHATLSILVTRRARDPPSFWTAIKVIQLAA
jgi:hypothetical protein